MICSVDGCAKHAAARGWCTTHYMRWRRTGSPHEVRRRAGLTVEERFWQYVDRRPDGCWTWTGSRSHGYGTFMLRRTDGSWAKVSAHRYAYELDVGPIPDGRTLDHLCHTAAIATCRDGATCPHRACVRPDHLEPVSLRANIRRGGNGTKTHCKREHEFTPENTGKTSTGGRYCRVCARMHAAALRERRSLLRA